MRLQQRLVNDVFSPRWRLKPDDSTTVPARGYKIGLAVAIHIGGLNVRGARLPVGNQPFRPGLGAIGRRFPPGKPFAAAGLGLRSALGRERDVHAAIAVHISHAKVVAEAGCVFVGKNKPLPALRGMRCFGHAQPGRRIRKGSQRLSAVGDEIELAVAVDIALEQSVDAIHLVIHQAQRPALLQWFLGLLQPGDPSRLIPRTDPIEIAVAIDIKELGMNEIVAVSFGENHLPPIGSDEQTRLAAGVADNVRLAILRKVARHGGACMQTLMNDMFSPRFFGQQTGSAGHNKNRPREC